MRAQHIGTMHDGTTITAPGLVPLPPQRQRQEDQQQQQKLLLYMDDNVFDVTQFVSRHPGGELLRYACLASASDAGKSCSKLFECYHTRGLPQLEAMPGVRRLSGAGYIAKTGWFADMRREVTSLLRRDDPDRALRWWSSVHAVVAVALYFSLTVMAIFHASPMLGALAGAAGCLVALVMIHPASHGSLGT